MNLDVKDTGNFAEDNRASIATLSDLPSIPGETSSLPRHSRNLTDMERAFAQVKQEHITNQHDEMHHLLTMYESVKDPIKKKELEIIIERKMETMDQHVYQYTTMVCDNDDSSYMLSLGEEDNEPLMDISDSLEDDNAMLKHHSSSIMEAAHGPLVADLMY